MTWMIRTASVWPLKSLFWQETAFRALFQAQGIHLTPFDVIMS